MPRSYLGSLFRACVFSLSIWFVRNLTCRMKCGRTSGAVVIRAYVVHVSQKGRLLHWSRGERFPLYSCLGRPYSVSYTLRGRTSAMSVESGIAGVGDARRAFERLASGVCGATEAGKTRARGRGIDGAEQSCFLVAAACVPVLCAQTSAVSTCTKWCVTRFTLYCSCRSLPGSAADERGRRWWWCPHFAGLPPRQRRCCC